jgi:(p)ppGpp synthase/HD superfamily hydrolase
MAASSRPLWHLAADFAARQHRHQLRKSSNTPYIAHPLRVALIVSSLFRCDDEQVLAAAILHDTIEDTETDYEDLEERFGPWVADAVATLSVNKALPEQRRQAEYHERLARADWRVLLIKVADACDAVRDSPDCSDRALAERALRKSRKIAELIRPRAKESPLLEGALAKLESLLKAAGVSAG